ncbi:MAG: hypothetical protein KDC38_05560 [Planctomycetes bacterium]|nr:hypothetical protein [Planctomycetota bacterium]
MLLRPCVLTLVALGVLGISSGSIAQTVVLGSSGAESSLVGVGPAPCPWIVQEGGLMTCTYFVALDPPDPGVEVCLGILGALPPGFTVTTANPACGPSEATIEIQCAPGYCDSGSYPVELYYSVAGTPTPAPQTLTVLDLPRLPTIDSVDSDGFDAGDLVTVNITYTDPDAVECGDPYVGLTLAPGTPGTLVDNFDGTAVWTWDTVGIDAGLYEYSMILDDPFGPPQIVPLSLRLREPPKRWVQLSAFLWDIHVDDDMDGFLRGDGELQWLSWARLSGEPADRAYTTVNQKEFSVEDGMTQGITELIFERKLCCRPLSCPIPSLEIVLHFWDDDNDTVAKTGKILEKLATPIGGATSPLGGLSAAAIGAILTEVGDPSRDELGTFRSLGLPVPFQPFQCTFGPTIPGMPGDPDPICHEIKLDGGAGASNGWIKLNWKSIDLGPCTEQSDPVGDSSSTTPSDDLSKAEMSQPSDRELRLGAIVAGDAFDIVPDGETREISFGLDTDTDPSTGYPLAPLLGSEFRVNVRLEGVGGGTVVSVTLFQWTGSSWMDLGVLPWHVDVFTDRVEVVIDRADIGAPPEVSFQVQILRNGIETDHSPNDPDVIHYIPSSVDATPPTVTAVEFHREIEGPIESIVVRFSEPVVADFSAPGTLPFDVAANYAVTRDYRTVTFDLLDPLSPGFRTLSLAGVTDFAGNPLDGNDDGVAGDPHVREFFAEDRSILPTDALGEYRNVFTTADSIHVVADGLPPSTTIAFAVVVRGPLVDGNPIFDVTDQGVTFVETDALGSVDVTSLGSITDDGEYTLIVDLDLDGVYDEGLDRIWREVGIGINVEEAPPAFRRGDANADGLFNISDAIFTLSALFTPGAPGPGCLAAADSNDDETFTIADAIFTLSALFAAGSPPPPPPGVSSCGPDPTVGIGCDAYSACP